MKKSIIVGGVSTEQREKELEKIKAKYMKRGYKFIDYIDNGTLKSVAVFEVDESILKKEKSKKLFIASGFFFLLAIVLFIKAN